MANKEVKPKKKRLKTAKRYPTFLFTEQAVFLAQVNGKGEQFSMFRETVLPSGLLSGGSVQDAKQLAAFLSEIKKQAKLKELEVVVGLSELKATTQSIILPQMASEEVTQAIENRASALLPFPYDDAYVDWQYISKPKEGDMTILLSAMPKAVVDAYAAVFEAAGLSVIAFETAASSLLRLIPPGSTEPSVAIEYSGSNATLIITQNGAIVASSVLQNGPDIVEKIQRMLDYYLSQQEMVSSSIGSVYLSGKNLTQQFVSGLSQALSIEPKLLLAEITNIARERQSELAVLASLARKNPALPEDEKTINLLPDEKALKLEEIHSVKQEKEHMVGALILLVIFLIMSAVSYVTLQRKTENLNQEIQTFSSQQNQNLTFSPALVTLIDTTMTDNKKLTSILDVLFDEAPQGIVLNGIQFDAETEQILLSGNAADRGALLSYRDRLELRDEMSEVTIPLSSLEHEVDVEFRMQISL